MLGLFWGKPAILILHPLKQCVFRRCGQVLKVVMQGGKGYQSLTYIHGIGIGVGFGGGIVFESQAKITKARQRVK